jgi:hypothetical protein
MELSVEDLFEMFEDTLQKCGLYLLNSTLETVGYNIYEEFDISVRSFLHPKSLNRLLEANYIDEAIFKKCNQLRLKTIAIEQSNEWDIDNFKTSPYWHEIMHLSDDIKKDLYKFSKDL